LNVRIKRVVNASPLILLSKIGRIELLNAEDVDVIVPVPVLEEVCPDLANAADPVVQAIGGAGWSVVPLSPVAESLSRWKLDPGEESVITIARHNPGSEVVIDDRAARRCAEAHGIAFLGTLGVVILAKRLGRIVEARPIIEDLRRAGLFVTDPVIADALKQAGE
jgi:predicted nucleic acid-binding protein